MVKVRCKSCQSIGYTASPEHGTCECGGGFEVISEDETVDKRKKE